MDIFNKTLNNKKFYPQIESLRGIAAFWIVILHIDWTFPGSNSSFLRNGYLMVDFFFILSGFVMTVNYYNKINKVKDFANFILLRFFRLYPLHLLTFLLFVISYLLFYMVKGHSLINFWHTFSLGMVPSIFYIFLYLVLLYFVSSFVYKKFENYYRIKGKKIVEKLNNL